MRKDIYILKGTHQDGHSKIELIFEDEKNALNHASFLMSHRYNFPIEIKKVELIMKYEEGSNAKEYE